MTDVASAWMQAGTETVMLPSGVQVRWEPTNVTELMLRGIMPGYLRSMAIQFTDQGVNPSELDEAESKRWKEMVSLLIIEGVREVAMPGTDEFEPIRLTPAQVNDADPRMPRVDLEALQHLVLHLRTPLEVNATSRMAQLELEYREAEERDASEEELEALRVRNESKAAEYARVIQKEASSSLAGWASFRDLGRSIVAGDPGPDVAPAPVEPTDHLGPGGKPRRRRRTRNPADGTSSKGATAPAV